MDIAAWLRGLGLEQYEPAFLANEIDEKVLPHLTSEDLREIRRGADRPSSAAARRYRGTRRLGAHHRSHSGSLRRLGSPRCRAAPAYRVFCDLVGSTPLSARFDPEDLRQIVGAYDRCVADAVGRFAGFITKCMGDGVLVYFGYPEAHEDDAVRQYRALPLPAACSWHRISFGPCTRQ